LFVIQPAELVSFAVVVIAAALSFLPVYFLHPVRVRRLRTLNLTIFLIWCGLGMAALVQNMEADYWIRIAIAAASLYLFCIGAVMQLFPGLGARKVNHAIRD